MKEPRVLDASPVVGLDAYRSIGGGKGLEAARRLGAAAVIDEVDASGLRGRGGAGFPTGRKWRTVASYETPDVPAIVAVNAAEGEPGSFKDRAIIRANPYRVIEGALIAALAVDADRVVIATKASFAREIERLQSAVDEIVAAGWAEGVDVSVLAGPSEYLYGEETALLEVLDGREPFPRIAPPWRRGIDDVPLHPGGHVEWAAANELVTPESDFPVAPALVDNVETLANVPGILAEGADWFRELGTPESPGTIVCTVSGRTRRAGVAEVEMGATLAEVIEAVGGGARSGRKLVAARVGCRERVHPRREVRYTAHLRSHAGNRLGAGRLRLRRVRRRERSRGGRAGDLALPRRGVVRTVHAVQAGRPDDQHRARSAAAVGR